MRLGLPIKRAMDLLACCGRSFRSLSRSAAKATASRLRGVGVLRSSQDWVRRATICETCPIRVVHHSVSYCGQPLLHRIDRPREEGCGCPTHSKAKDPSEHCPLTPTHTPSVRIASACTCKWCAPA